MANKKVRLDIPFSEMLLEPGEKIIDKLDYIEDTKGNGGDGGRLLITNLRIFWQSIVNPRINLSIGFDCISNINSKVVNCKLKGSTQALFILTFANYTRLEFIFTNLVPVNTRHFASVVNVLKAYRSSKVYRELKLRGAVVHNKQLKMLRLEQVYNTFYGIWNLSNDQGIPGTLIITNIRIVWFADMNEAFNVSLPFLQIESVRESKFGKALVILCVEECGGYTLGFKINPEDSLNLVYKELLSLITVYSTCPIYGVECKSNTKEDEDVLQPQQEEIVEIEEPRNEMSNILITYIADIGHHKDRPVIYSTDLGLAIETVRQGYTVQKLWEVLPS